MRMMIDVFIHNQTHHYQIPYICILLTFHPLSSIPYPPLITSGGTSFPVV